MIKKSLYVIKEVEGFFLVLITTQKLRSHVVRFTSHVEVSLKGGSVRKKKLIRKDVVLHWEISDKGDRGRGSCLT